MKDKAWHEKVKLCGFEKIAKKALEKQPEIVKKPAVENKDQLKTD